MTSKTDRILNQKFFNIELVLTDVDGVLTDGGRYYSEMGEILKKFHTRDGMGVNILLRNKIKTVIVTKEKSKIVKKWAKNMNVEKVFDGIKIKEDVLNIICKEFKVKPDQIAYIGDDVNDIGLLHIVGLSACPSDSSKIIKKEVDYVCKNGGGNTAFREIVDMIIISKFPKQQKWY
jgi:3-deoxy-D-manno-octulosonate 8-phosphate phosphatase (KDO 8-P phosphatase)